tara:strand:+ start:1283 stop:1684 length:402 start_codon:yes stop_codon:yes gene_type:complete
MDVHTPQQRRYNMSRIKGKNTKPEMVVRRLCHALGYRFRLHRKDLPGRPDLVFPRYEVAIFVHGCFWHSHDCKYGSVQPKTNQKFWKEKRQRTVERDRENIKEIAKLGWKYLVIWECQTKDVGRLSSTIKTAL